MKRKVLTSMVIGSTGLLAMLGLWYLQPIKFDQAQGTQEKSFVKETANKTETGPKRDLNLKDGILNNGISRSEQYFPRNYCTRCVQKHLHCPMNRNYTILPMLRAGSQLVLIE